MGLNPAGFAFACLPYEAFFSLDAIVRTAFRVLVSHRRLLEWSLAGDARSTNLAASFRTMVSAPVLSAAAALFLAHFRPDTLVLAAPILALWFASPALAWWLGRPFRRQAARLTAAETHFLHAVARRTWTFFERFVGPKDHWLPPDNVQEHPAAAIAHRTSPTNMGLSLLANLAAYDFGYLSTGRLVERTANAIHTMASLERYRGHFYNWYDTQSLQPLRPHYVSSVDSGNLAGHLLTLRQGLLGLPDKKIVGPNLFAGLADTLQMVVDATEDAVSAELARVESAVISAADDPPRTLTAVRHRLESITKAAESLVNRLVAGPDSQAKVWAQALAQQCQDALADLTFIAPWTSLPEAPSQPGRIYRPRSAPDPARVGWDRVATPARHRGAALAGRRGRAMVGRVAATGGRVQPARAKADRGPATACTSRG